MATEIKYISYGNLGYYDEKIKAYITNADLQVLADANASAEAKDAIIQAAAAAAQATADANTEKIGTVAEGETVMGKIASMQETITNIQENAYDDTELRELIQANTDAISDEETRATGVESGLDTRLKAVEDDYLTSEDKDELSDAIAAEKERAEAAEKANADAIAILNGTGDGSVTKTIDEAINKFATDVTNDDVVNSYKELIDWVAEHGSEAAEIAAAIEANEAAISDLEALVGSLPEGETSATIVAFIQKLVAAEQARAEGIEAGLDERLEAVEGTSHTHDNKTVLDGITAEKVTAWDSAEQDAKDYADSLATNYDAAGAANTALTSANSYTDAEIDKVEARVEALEAVEYVEVTTTEIDELFA